MERKCKVVPISVDNSQSITVYEAGWDYTFRFNELDKQVEELLKEPNSTPVFEFFCRNYYALMAACVDHPPTPQAAYALEGNYLNDWYLAVWELNEDILGSPFPKETLHEEVTFRDGNSLVVWQAQGLPSFVLHLVELENYANEHPLEDDPAGQMFQLMFYPKMAASCNGSKVPDFSTVRNWPRSEISKWMEASRRMNPDWYLITEEEKAVVAEQKATDKKKKVKKSLDG